MEQKNPIEFLLTVKQACIMKVLSEGDILTGGEIMELAPISKSGFYPAMKKLQRSGLVRTVSVGKQRAYQINKIGLSLSGIAKEIARSNELSTSDLEKISGKLEEITHILLKTIPILEEIKRINKKQNVGLVEKLKLRKLREKRDKILQQVDIFRGLSNVQK